MSAPTGVARLFVGLPVPPAVARTLERLGPRAGDGIRRIAAADMHVTLHFLGSREVAPVSECLRGVAAAGFALRLGSAGSFAPRPKRRVLFVDVLPAAGLAGLHRLTALALRAVDFEPEPRAYRPHVTVARLDATAPRDAVASFATRIAEASGLEFECSRFALFASETAADGARYSVIESYPLAGGR